MRVRGIQSGFDFLQQPAGFAISESLWEFDSAETYAKAFLIGLSNTLRVAIVGIVLATILGTLVGIGRLSRNFLVRSLCTAYVELFRNVPLLLQLFIWYFVLTRVPAADRRGAAAVAERLLQQERPAVSDSGVGDGPRLAGGWASSAAASRRGSGRVSRAAGTRTRDRCCR